MSTSATKPVTTENLTQSKEAVVVYRMVKETSECPWGRRAVDLLADRGIKFEDVHLTSDAAVAEFKANHAVETTPQIFWGDRRLGGYTDLAEHLGEMVEEDERSYTPVIALFSTAGLMAIATSLGMTGFMGISLSMLASLKLMDLDSFVEGFEKYDLLTQRLKLYGKAYPFLELAIGLGFLAGVAPLVTGIGSLAVGVSGGISVIKAVYLDKKDLNCACIGGNSKAPLGVISFTENAMMAVMGVVLIGMTVLPKDVAPQALRDNSKPELTQVSSRGLFQGSSQ
jgi:glutaredoxin